MRETDRLEDLLGAGHDVRLARRDAYEVLQKLRARGGRTEAAERLESRLSDGDEIEWKGDGVTSKNPAPTVQVVDGE